MPTHLKIAKNTLPKGRTVKNAKISKCRTIKRYENRGNSFVYSASIRCPRKVKITKGETRRVRLRLLATFSSWARQSQLPSPCGRRGTVLTSWTVYDDERWMVNVERWRMMCGEWWMMNGERWILNGEWCWLANDDWWMMNGKWLVNEEWWVENEERRLKTEEWRMDNEEWRMKNGEWRMENGEWRMKNEDWREWVNTWTYWAPGE